MDGAMKLARQYFFEQGLKSRTHFIARQQSYHGTTIGAMSLGSNLPRKLPYESLLLPHISHVSPAYAYQYQHPSETEAMYVLRLVQELEDEISRVGAEKVIAFVAEPVVGATTACVTAPKGYFRSVREICDRYGVLLILDEVMCGVGRTGTYFAFEQEGIVPDIMTFGKGLGGGYAPIAGILMNGKVVDVLRNGTGVFVHGHTYQAHPLQCAIALAVQKIVKREGLVKRCQMMGELLGRLLKEALSESKYVGNIRGRGLFWGIEFVKDRETKTSFDPKVKFGSRVQERAFELGVAIYPGAGTVDGKRGDHVLIAPPYTVTEAELQSIVAVVTVAITVEAGVHEGECEFFHSTEHID